MKVLEQIQADELLRRAEQYKKVRQAARTNLLYLCNHILDYKDVTREVHGEIIDHLQKFKGGTDTIDEKGIIKYTPTLSIRDFSAIKSPRNRLILFPRGHFKTTIITIAHAIQWIINFPDIRIALSMAIGDQTKKVMSELRDTFRFNPRFRLFFPEFCPQSKKSNDWGNMEEFTVPNRVKFRREPTACLITIGKVIAGSHYDIVKHSDLVDENNVKTPNQIADVVSHFGHMDPLIERYITDDPEHPITGWQDVEGTRYDFGDLYGVLLKAPKEWECLVRSAFKDDGTTIDMRRFPPAELERIKRKPEMTPYIFSCQYLNKPIPPEGGLCDPKDIKFLSRQILGDIQPMLRLHCTIDLHGLEADRHNSDFTVLNVHGFDRDGRLYVLDIRRGRFTPSEFVWHFFDIIRCWNQLIDFKVERVILWAALRATLQAEMSKRGRFACIVELKRDNRMSKQQRIRGLQAWFKSGRIRFAEDLTCKEDLILEIMQFPSQSSGVHDDLLDTMADAMQNAEGETNMDVIPDPSFDSREMFGMQKPRDRFLGFNNDGSENWLYGEPSKAVDSPTGVL